ncbi:MAG: Rrf2 family transcriptional regulator [Alphaproteobacteria bacterium]|nr:Rrf2 family transcriptional regulator [Alphaproteobacteria bacterium]MBO4643150.1 Rrf2 family transcriptional regulator [Alphaproteobacteria bacterium]
MKISTKGRYGLRILLDLALYGQDAPRLMKEIADSQQISEKYISRLILPLNEAGFITSFRGAKGGLKLAKSPKEISLLEIVEAMEGRLAIVDCVFDKDFCPKSDNCSACKIWSSLNKKIRKQMAEITLKDVLKSEKKAKQTEEKQ